MGFFGCFIRKCYGTICCSIFGRLVNSYLLVRKTLAEISSQKVACSTKNKKWENAGKVSSVWRVQCFSRFGAPVVLRATYAVSPEALTRKSEFSIGMLTKNVFNTNQSLLYLMPKMKKALTIAVLLLISLSPSLAIAQSTPPDVPTLGPVTFFYTDYSGNDIKIFSPQNQSSYSNQIQLNFTIERIGVFGQFGNVGYSLDGGIINSIRNMTKSVDDKTDYGSWYYYKTTASANVLLPALSDGNHNVTVYYGWQYLGIPENPSLERFEVSSLKTVEFTVDTSTPAISEDLNPVIALSGIVIVIVVAVGVGLLVFFKKGNRKNLN